MNAGRELDALIAEKVMGLEVKRYAAPGDLDHSPYFKAPNGTCGRNCVDHIKPRSKFPELELVFENMQVLCRACNLGKSNLDETDFRKISNAIL